jgi:hypothetical protein
MHCVAPSEPGDPPLNPSTVVPPAHPTSLASVPSSPVHAVPPHVRTCADNSLLCHV